MHGSYAVGSSFGQTILPIVFEPSQRRMGRRRGVSVNDLVHGPHVLIQFKAENRVGGRVELAVPDPHKGRRVVLEAIVVDPDDYFDIGQLGEGILVPDGAYLHYPDGKGAMNLRIGRANHGIADLDIVAELEITAFLGQAGYRPPITQGTDVPQVVMGAAVYFPLVQNHLLPVELHGMRFQGPVGGESTATAPYQHQTDQTWSDDS
jgi:hypothetical protein